MLKGENHIAYWIVWRLSGLWTRWGSAVILYLSRQSKQRGSELHLIQYIYEIWCFTGTEVERVPAGKITFC